MTSWRTVPTSMLTIRSCIYVMRAADNTVDDGLSVLAACTSDVGLLPALERPAALTGQVESSDRRNVTSAQKSETSNT